MEGPDKPADIPIAATAAAEVLLSYDNEFLDDPTLPNFIATNNYDYRFFSQAGIPAPQTGSQTVPLDGIVMMAPNEDIDVSVVAQASAEFLNPFADQAEIVSDSATADPTFQITDPAFSDYAITGVPEGSAPVVAAPEPATWAMLLIGFIGLGTMGYWRSRREVLGRLTERNRYSH
jgi:hypothetical protein